MQRKYFMRIEQGTIEALFLAGTNPLVNFPESGRWRKALEKLELLIVQDILCQRPDTTGDRGSARFGERGEARQRDLP